MATTGGVNIDFDNPLEPGWDDISFDVFDLQDSKQAIMLKNEAMDVFTRRNVFKGVTEFQGIVISEPKDLINNPGFVDNLFQSLGTQEKPVAFKIHIPALHAMLGNPCDTTQIDKYGTSKEAKDIAIKKIIQRHPWFITKGIFGLLGQKTPSAGDWITVKFAKGPSGGRTIEGQIVKILGTKTQLANVCDQSAIDIFNSYNNGVTPLSSNTNLTTGGAEQKTGAGISNETDLIFAYPFVQGSQSGQVTSRLNILRDMTKYGLGIGSHTGVDFGLVEGSVLLASADGVVERANGGNGEIRIKHTDSTGKIYYTVYHHCSAINVAVGNSVVQGEQVGLSGNVGRSTGPHLHFEIRRDFTIDWQSADWKNGKPTAADYEKFNRSCIDPLVALTLPGIAKSFGEILSANNSDNTVIVTSNIAGNNGAGMLSWDESND